MEKGLGLRASSPAQAVPQPSMAQIFLMKAQTAPTQELTALGSAIFKFSIFSLVPEDAKLQVLNLDIHRAGLSKGLHTMTLILRGNRHC